MAENLRYIHPLRTRKCLAALLVRELIDEDKKAKKRGGKTRAWTRRKMRRSSKGCYNNIVKELMIEDSAGYTAAYKEIFYTLGTARAWAQHVERCCANALDFVEPRMDDRETKIMLSRVERKV